MIRSINKAKFVNLLLLKFGSHGVLRGVISIPPVWDHHQRVPFKGIKKELPGFGF